MNALMRWCVPDGLFGGYRDQIRLFYEKQWIELPVGRRLDYMRRYGVQR